MLTKFLRSLQHYLAKPWPRPAKIIAIAAAVGLVTVIRWSIDQGVNGFNFSPYLPVILIVAVLLGWRYAVFTAVLSVESVIWVFMEPDWFERPWPVRLVLLGLFAVIVAVIVLVSEGLRTLMAEAEQNARRVQTFNDELQHRTGNMVQVLVNWIERGALEDDPKGYFNQLSGHLISWARSNEMLRSSNLSAFDLHELIKLSLAPFGASEIQIEGSPVRVEGNSAREAAMALHELGTNSLKYGALACGGDIRIHWDELDDWLQLTWAERGEFSTLNSSGSGFGLRLLAGLEHIEGMEITQHEDSFTCRFRIRAAD